MLLSGFRYNELKKSRRFVSTSFADAATHQPTWLEAHYIERQDKWDIYSYQNGYSQTYKMNGLFGTIVAEKLNFSDAVKHIKAFQTKNRQDALKAVHNDFSDDFMHIDDAEKILEAQKYSIRQRFFGLRF